MNWDCDRCGGDPCVCNRENDMGYECGTCGTVPTTREVHDGSCRVCRERRRAARETPPAPAADDSS